MTRSSPPSRPGPPDTEPVPPSLPPGAEDDLVPWGDTDIDAPPGPVPAFSTNARARSDDQMPTIGHIGRYALKYKIGAGGLGTVYAAHDPLLSRLIAIKTLNLEISADEREAFNAMFLNEARAAGSLSHPHIVTVFDAGISTHDGDSSAYIAMELLKGRDLRQLRQEGWRPTPTQAALIVRRVADALAYAHSKGVVHRDIKPANIFMVGRTQPRVLDFGIARVAHQRDGGAGDIAAGSPYYMAPEQARHESVDRRADVFSLGVVFYELLTDQKPFRGGTLREITAAVLEHEPPPAHQVAPTVPAALAEIAARAMEKDPEHRFRSARSLSRELRHWLDENADAPAGATAESELANPPRRWWPLAAVTVVALAGIALWVGLSSHHETAAQAVAATPVATPPAPAALPTTSTSTEAPPAAVNPAPPIAAAQTPTAPVVPAVPAPAVAPPPTAASPRPTVAAAPAAPRESPRAREAREREAKARAAAALAPALATGTVRIAVSPWGQVEVDGTAAGIAPPLNELTLPEGKHQITIRNTDFPPYSATVTVTPGQPMTLKHKFGS